ncbi:MAG: hypothetical protein KJZ80_17860 [Hyphomicrobiaceae bacterium]|nr:hypothetical protein [Hyphomicrobiaceae bacterium]
MPTNHRAAYAGALIAALAAWIALSFPWLSGAVTIPYDAKAHFQAQLQFLAGALHSGQSPFWVPHVFAGSPQIADPQSLIFSPAILLAYFDATPSFRELDAYVLVLLGLGGLSIFMLGRDQGWHPAGALLAALTFAFGASAAWRIQHIGQIQSLALFGITLWLLTRALDRSSIGFGIAAGIAAGLMVVKPDQVALLASYVLAGRVVAHWLERRHKGFGLKNSVTPLLSGAAAAAVISGLPLLMTYLFAEASSRPVIPYEEAIRGSLNPASLLTFFIGDLFGALDPRVEYWGPSSPGWGNGDLWLSQNMTVVYLGALPAIAIFTIGMTRGLLWEREMRVYTVAWLLVLSYALGRFTPVFGAAFDHLPVVDAFRRPADATFVVGALMALQAGYVCHRCATGTIPPASWMMRLLEAALPAAIFIAALSIAAQLGKLDVAWKPISSAAGWCAASAAALGLLIGTGRQRPVLAASVIGALVGADLFVNNGPNESTALSPERYEFLQPDTKNATVRLLKDKLRRSPGSPWRDRVELVGLGYEWPNAALIHGFDHVLGNNPLRLKVITDAVGAGDTIAGPDQRHFTPLFPSYRSLLSNMMGLRFIASSIPIERVDRRLAPGDLKLIARTKDAYLYENPRALPRVMLVHDWQVADFDHLIRTGAWPRFDPLRTVLLDQTPAPQPGPPAAGRGGAGSSIALKSYENTEVEVLIEAPRSGFLILYDVWHPWWQATVDGEPVEIMRANVLFRAVQVPAGRHAVHFSFTPLTGAVAELME